MDAYALQYISMWWVTNVEQQYQCYQQLSNIVVTRRVTHSYLAEVEASVKEQSYRIFVTDKVGDIVHCVSRASPAGTICNTSEHSVDCRPGLQEYTKHRLGNAQNQFVTKWSVH